MAGPKSPEKNQRSVVVNQDQTEANANVKDSSELRMTEQQIAEMREAFQLFDRDGDGHVTPKELRIVLQTLGQDPSDQEILEMIDDVDKDGNKEIEFEEFCMLMCKQMTERDDQETLTEAFKMLDADGSGEINRVELKEILRSFSKMGEDIADEEIDNLISEADVDGDGQISYDEVRSDPLLPLLSMFFDTLSEKYALAHATLNSLPRL